MSISDRTGTTNDRLARGIAALGGAFFVGFGAFAVVSPRGFFDSLATWPPFNVHFIHDIGAFQIGLGLALLIALVRGDALLVALAAVGAGQTVHTIVHFTDSDLGGKSSDPYVMLVLAVLLLAGAFLRLRGSRNDRVVGR